MTSEKYTMNEIKGSKKNPASQNKDLIVISSFFSSYFHFTPKVVLSI